jgi:hypothetical protein
VDYLVILSLDAPRETTKDLSKDSQSVDGDSNSGPSEYEE